MATRQRASPTRGLKVLGEEEIHSFIDSFPIYLMNIHFVPGAKNRLENKTEQTLHLFEECRELTKCVNKYLKLVRLWSTLEKNIQKILWNHVSKLGTGWYYYTSFLLISSWQEVNCEPAHSTLSTHSNQMICPSSICPFIHPYHLSSHLVISPSTLPNSVLSFLLPYIYSP